MTKFQGLELNPIICAGCDQPMFDERTILSLRPTAFSKGLTVSVNNCFFPPFLIYLVFDLICCMSPLKVSALSNVTLLTGPRYASHKYKSNILILYGNDAM